MLGTGVIGWTVSETEATEIIHIENAVRARVMLMADPPSVLDAHKLLSRPAEIAKPGISPEKVRAAKAAFADFAARWNAKQEKR